MIVEKSSKHRRTIRAPRGVLPRFSRSASGAPLSALNPAAGQRTLMAPLRLGRCLASIPFVIFFYVAVVLPLLPDDGQGRLENNIFWPSALFVVSVLVWINRRRIELNFCRALPVAALSAYMVLAAASLTWAYSPEYASTRFVVHALTCVVLFGPYALPNRMDFTITALCFVYAVAFSISAVYVLTTPATSIGHTGYFTHKQELGLLGASGLIVATHEALFRGWRRALGAIVACVGVWLIIASQSKSAFSFSLFAMVSAWFILVVCKYTRMTPAFVVGAVVAATFFVDDIIPRLGARLYGDPSLTGRVGIWWFIEGQIAKKEWLGWGFHSFHFVPHSPMRTAPGYISFMPSSHSGYLELRLETGRIGYWIFLVFIFSSLHVVEFVRRADPVRAWCYLSIMIFALLINSLDSVWLVHNSLWILYLIIVAESVRFSLQSKNMQLQPAGRQRIGFSVLRRHPRVVAGE